MKNQPTLIYIYPCIYIYIYIYIPMYVYIYIMVESIIFIKVQNYQSTERNYNGFLNFIVDEQIKRMLTNKINTILLHPVNKHIKLFLP